MLGWQKRVIDDVAGGWAFRPGLAFQPVLYSIGTSSMICRLSVAVVGSSMPSGMDIGC